MKSVVNSSVIVLSAMVFAVSGCTKPKNQSKTTTGSAGSADANYFTANDQIQNNKIELGLNKVDLSWQYVGKSSGPDGSAAHAAVQLAMARKSIVDARNNGATFFRVGITGFAPSSRGAASDLELWVNNPSAYWAALDQMMTDLSSHGMRLVPSFVWNQLQFPAMTPSDTLHDFMTNQNSASYKLMVKYIQQFVSRYKDNPAILFYELGNEMNLNADLDVKPRCLVIAQKYNFLPSFCDVWDHYTTSEMATFMGWEAAVIRSIDPNHLISSGNSIPRQSAEHMRAMPEWINGSTDFTPDTMTQLIQNLGDISSGADIVSIHSYNSNGEDDRFGYNGAEILTLFNNIVTQNLNKKLYVGEYGKSDGSSPNSPNDYSWKIVDKVVNLKIPYSSPWVFEFYQNSLTAAASFNLEEGYTDSFLAHYKSTSAQLGDWVPPQGQDTTPPSVILTWPLSGTTIDANQQLLYAVASDERGAVSRVDFFFDGRNVGSASQPPYQMNLSSFGLPPGTHTLSAVAYDPSGNTSTSSTAIQVPAMSCPLTVNGGSYLTPAAGQNMTWSIANFKPGMIIHWYGFVYIHGQQVNDLSNFTSTSPSVFDGPLPLLSNGNIYYRYAILTDSSGNQLCDTRGPMFNLYQITSVQPVPYTCTMTMNDQQVVLNSKVGTNLVVKVNTNATNVTYHWFGSTVPTALASTVQPTVDTVDLIEDPVGFTGPFQAAAGGNTYTRYVILYDSAGTPICDSRSANPLDGPITVNVAP